MSLAHVGEEKPEERVGGNPLLILPREGRGYAAVRRGGRRATAVLPVSRGIVRRAAGDAGGCAIMDVRWKHLPMRVIAGQAKGRALRSLRGSAMRPTSARVRAALFSILGDTVLGGPFLDLYAGTGAVGIEALSRGAPWADFVEQYRAACEVLRRNLAAAGCAERARVIPLPVARFLTRPADRTYAVVFADPPYGAGEVERVLTDLAGWSGLTPETLVVVQHSSREEVRAEGWRLVRRESYGDTRLSFFRPEEGTR